MSINKKQKTVKEVIEILSTANEAVDAEEKDNCLQGYNPEGNTIKNQDMLVDEIVNKVVNNLSTLIVNQSYMVSSSQTHSVQPNSLKENNTPNHSPVTVFAVPNVAFMCTPPVRLTRTTPSNRPNSMVDDVTLKDGNIVRNLFHEQSDENNIDRLINCQSLQSQKMEKGKTHVKIRHWMHLSFRPPIDLLLDDNEAAIVCYIFKIDLQDRNYGEEILVKCEWQNGQRNLFRSLIPRNHVHPEILNLLASMLTYNERRVFDYCTTWFLPATFAQAAMHWETTSDAMKNLYKDKFMSKVDFLKKIFVPMYDECMHWYLLIIDLKEKNLVLLDSVPNPSRKE